MSNQRFRPNLERPTGRTGKVPVTRPVGRQQVQQSSPRQVQQPTHSYEEEQVHEEQVNQRPQSEPQNTTRLAMPPNLGGFEDDFEEEEKTKNKSNVLKFVLFGVVGILLLAVIAFGVMKLLDGKDSPTIDGSQLAGESQVGDGMAIPDATNDAQNVNFDGNPVPVKWPADVQPTRMELQLDPVSGEPVLLLVGDKSGLGTVIRSYDGSGSLTGYWVIVPDDGKSESNAPADNSNNGEQTADEANEENADGEVEQSEDAQQ